MEHERYVATGDCYSVKGDGDGRFLVRHFPNRKTRRPCCEVRVMLTDADRAQAIPDADPHGEAACLHRAYVAIEAQHAQRKEACGAHVD